MARHDTHRDARDAHPTQQQTEMAAQFGAELLSLEAHLRACGTSLPAMLSAYAVQAHGLPPWSPVPAPAPAEELHAEEREARE